MCQSLYNCCMDKNFKLTVIISLICIVAVSIVYLWAKPQEKNNDEVVFWSLQMGTFDGYMKPLIAEFEKQNPDIKIKWIDVPYSEGEKRTLASILSSTPPDLVNLTPDFSSVLAQKQALEYIDCKKLNSYNKQIVQSLMVDDKCYAVPFYATSSVTFYNKQLLQKAGVKKIPATYNQLNEIAPLIKSRTGAFVTMPTLTENDTLLKILNKSDINTPETFVTDKSVQIFNGYRQLYQNDLIPKESVTQNHQEALEKYMSGQLAFIQSGANFLNIVKENAPQVFKYTDVSSQLVGDNGKYDVSIMNLIIPARAIHKDGALRFALFLTNKQNQIELAKLTTVLPVNNEALKDEYFNTFDKNDVISKARVLSSKQLGNLQKQVKFANNHKEILTLLNTTVQQILLENGSIKEKLETAADNWKRLE